LAIGTIDALETVELTEVAAFHRRWFRPSRAVLVVVGDAPAAEVEETASAAFSGWHDVANADEGGGHGSVLADPFSSERRLLLVDRPGAAQSELRIGHVAVSRRTPDYHALLLLNLVLGGQFVSRLNMNLR